MNQDATIKCDYMSDRPHVLISSGRLATGGMSTNLPLICCALRSRQAEVTVFATDCSWPADQIARLMEMGVHLIIPPRQIRKRPSLILAWGIWTIARIRFRQYRSLLVMGSGKSHRLVMSAMRPDVYRWYYEIVAAPPIGKHPSDLCDRADGLLATSQKVADDMKRLWPDKPCGVAAPISTDQVNPPAPIRRSLADDRVLRVVYMGRIAGQKRVIPLIAAWPQLSARPDLAPATLDIFGGDDGFGHLAKAQALVRDAPYHGITVHGPYHHSDIDAILSNADMLVLPSNWEGLPHVLVEAMLRGVPIVSTDAGGSAEFGENNPDVVITSVEWGSFEAGVIEMAKKIRRREIEPARLHRWVSERYGYEKLSEIWCQALIEPRCFLTHASR